MAGVDERVERVLVAAGCRPHRMERRQLWSAQMDWRRVYAQHLHAATGRWTEEKYDWHVFCRGHYPSASGVEAEQRLLELEPSERFFVVSGWIEKDLGFACSGKAPMELKMRVDLLVFGGDLSWTMAFTHDDVHGPYFAERMLSGAEAR
ncbi:MAG: hypothetical protein JNJ54_04260 [Myxococcaceae bacterium]|nr:hypothetical protein [Myxococcaceae bacterium]